MFSFMVINYVDLHSLAMRPVYINEVDIETQILK